MPLDHSLIDVADDARHINLSHDRRERSDIGQFLTPMSVASPLLAFTP